MNKNLLGIPGASVDAILSKTLDGGWNVAVVWQGFDVDRASTGGFGLSAKHEGLARRLVAAIKAGAVYDVVGIAKDVDGKTYVDARCRVLGRTMNADLKRLGF